MMIKVITIESEAIKIAGLEDVARSWCSGPVMVREEGKNANEATQLAFISRGRNQTRGRNPTGLRDKRYVMAGNDCLD